MNENATYPTTNTQVLTINIMHQNTPKELVNSTTIKPNHAVLLRSILI